MLHKMSEVRGWSHKDMMAMKKHIFYRYYGYWYQDNLREEERQKEQERKQKKMERNDKVHQWKKLGGGER